jgi:hypothetical protein
MSLETEAAPNQTMKQAGPSYLTLEKLV